MKNSRFYILAGLSIEESGLVGSEYTKLPKVGKKKQRIVIDSHLGNYWYSSAKAIPGTVAIMRLRYKEEPKVILTKNKNY